MNAETVKVGERVWQLRLERGLAQSQLGKFAGLTQPYISNVERGIHTPSVVNILRLAKALGVPVGELLQEGEA